MLFRFVLSVVVSLWLALPPTTGAGAEGRDSQSPGTWALEGFQSHDPQARAEAVRSLIRGRSEIVNTLTRLAASKSGDRLARYVKYDAIRLLGAYRASEACDVLIDEIDYAPGMEVSERGPLSRYPAAEALVQIGSPAAERVLTRVKKPTSAAQARLFAYVVYLIDGKELASARLEIAVARAEEDAARANLSRFVELFKGISFDDMRQWPDLQLLKLGRN